MKIQEPYIALPAVFLGLALWSCAVGRGVGTVADLKDGDVLFQDSHSSQSEDIKSITHSRFCHVGVYFTEDGR